MRAWYVVLVIACYNICHATPIPGMMADSEEPLEQLDTQKFDVGDTQDFGNNIQRFSQLSRDDFVKSIPDITQKDLFRSAVRGTTMFGDNDFVNELVGGLHRHVVEESKQAALAKEQPQISEQNFDVDPSGRKPAIKAHGSRPLVPGQQIDTSDPDNYFPVEEGMGYKIKQFWHIFKPIYPVILAGIANPAEVKPDYWFPIVLNHLLPIAIKFFGNSMDPGSLPIPPDFLPTIQPQENTGSPLPTSEHRPGVAPEDKYAPAPPPPPIPPPLPKGYESPEAGWRGHIVMPMGTPPGIKRRTMYARQ